MCAVECRNSFFCWITLTYDACWIDIHKFAVPICVHKYTGLQILTLNIYCRRWLFVSNVATKDSMRLWSAVRSVRPLLYICKMHSLQFICISFIASAKLLLMVLGCYKDINLAIYFPGVEGWNSASLTVLLQKMDELKRLKWHHSLKSNIWNRMHELNALLKCYRMFS